MDQTRFELLEAPIFCGAGPKKRIVKRPTFPDISIEI